MRNTARAMILAVLGCLGCKAKSPSDQFNVGEVWRYHTRPNEEDSRVIIGRIERDEKAGVIVHVKISGVKIKNPTAPGGVSHVVTHSPISEEKLKASVTEREEMKGDLSGFEEDYMEWRQARGGVFTITIAEIVETLEYGIANASEWKSTQ